MLDLAKTIQAQQAGETLLTGITEDEKTILSSYCWLAGRDLLKAGAQRQAPVDEVVMNAFRNGIALGLCLKVTNHQILERSSF